MKAIRLPGTVTVGLFVLASAAGCTIQSGTVQLLPDSGIYGQAWSRGESGARYSKLASRGRYFNVESPDRRILVRTIVIADDGSFKAKLDPAYYFIDTEIQTPFTPWFMSGQASSFGRTWCWPTKTRMVTQ